MEAGTNPRKSVTRAHVRRRRVPMVRHSARCATQAAIWSTRPDLSAATALGTPTNCVMTATLPRAALAATTARPYRPAAIARRCCRRGSKPGEKLRPPVLRPSATKCDEAPERQRRFLAHVTKAPLHAELGGVRVHRIGLGRELVARFAIGHWREPQQRWSARPRLPAKPCRGQGNPCPAVVAPGCRVRGRNAGLSVPFLRPAT
jgi:hypothetical protein